MIANLHRIEEREMLKNWALAEVASVRRQKYLDTILPNELVEKIRGGDFHFDTKEEGILEDMIRKTRKDLLEGILDKGITWYEGELPCDELEILEIMNWPPFVELAGSRKLIDLARAFEEGKMPNHHHEFSAHLKHLRDTFVIEHMHGKPILLGKEKDPPYMLIEGFTRLSALLMNLREGKDYRGSFPVILGVYGDLGKWKFA